MLPLLGLVFAGVSTAISAGQAVAIGAGIGAATAIGSNVLKPKNKTRNVDTDDGVTDEILKEAMIEALKIIKKRYDI